MRKVLTALLLAAATLTASAYDFNLRVPARQSDKMAAAMSKSTFKEKYQLDYLSDMQRDLRGFSLSTRNYMAAQADDELVTDPQGAKSRYAMAVDIFLSHLGATHVGGFGAEVITSETDSKFYSKAFTLNFFQQGYSEGEIDGDKVVFHSGQYIYDTQDGEKAYMYAAYLAEGEEWPEFCDTFELVKDDQGRYVSEPGYYFMVMTEEEAEAGINDSSSIICFGTNYVFTPLPEGLTDAVLPDDAEVFDCQLYTNSLTDYGQAVLKDITVGVSGDTVYIGGLSDYLSGSYMVGTIGDGNTVTFKSGQYIGYHDHGDYPYIYEFAMVNPIYFDGESIMFNSAESMTMTFNEEHTLLSIEEGAGIFVCSYGDMSSWNEVYWNMLIGDFNQSLTPSAASDVNCYGSYGSPYLTFEWSNISEEGLPMNSSKLWCEVVLNGENYLFTPEAYEGLAEATERVYFNTSEVDGLYTGDFTTLYLYEMDGKFSDIKSLGVRIGYEGNGEVSYSEVAYAKGFEPFEDGVYTPSAPSNLVFYKDYYNNIRFKFDGKDVEGNVIPDRILGVEILLDGEVLVFKDSDYYFGSGDGDDVTIIGLSENAPNYSSSLVTGFNGEYVLALWGHDELPDFNTLEVRPVCTGGGTLTYGEGCQIVLNRAAVPANPWNVALETEWSNILKFGAMPIDTNGEGLSPWSYGYEVYVNDELYTFPAELYDLDNDITVIPYEGFEYNYNFYLSTERVYDETDWSVIDMPVVMSVSMLDEDLSIKKIGVRAVYTDGEGNTTYSEIVNNDGTSGVNGVIIENEPVKWYNLQGIGVAHPQSGGVYLRQHGGKTQKVYVK